MQRTFVAITLALTLSCACASYINAQNYVKNVATAVQNNETNYTATNVTLQLVSINAAEVDLVASNVTLNTGNLSASTWATVYRKLDTKTLTSTANTTFSLTQPLAVQYGNGYAYSVVAEKDSTNTSQINVYQTAVSGGAVVQRITLTNNTNVNVTLAPLAYPVIGKVVYVFYQVGSSQLNVSSFTIGGAKGSLTFNFTTTYNKTLQVAWGEALGSSQIYANWIDTDVLKYSVIDVTKGTFNATPVGTWTTNYTCTIYTTDKKYYGEICSTVNATNVSAQTVNYYARYNSSSLAPLNNGSSLSYPTNALAGAYPYGPYVALVYADQVTTAGNTTYSYEILNLDTLALFKARTVFLTTDYTVSFFRVTSAGLYTFTYVEQTANASLPTYSNVQVGQVLGGSYLTSVLGFIMTIVAGVLLF